MSWLLLVLAGLLEVGWAVGLKYTDGFRRPVPSLLVIAAISGSMFLLGVATRSLPISTAYAVWVGIGTVGTSLLGMTLLHEPANPAKLFFLALLVVAIAGLKLSSGSAH